MSKCKGFCKQSAYKLFVNITKPYYCNFINFLFYSKRLVFYCKFNLFV